VVVPITNGTPGSPVSVAGTTQLQGVACASATICEGVGYGSSNQGVGYGSSNQAVGYGSSNQGVACLLTR